MYDSICLHACVCVCACPFINIPNSRERNLNLYIYVYLFLFGFLVLNGFFIVCDYVTTMFEQIEAN